MPAPIEVLQVTSRLNIGGLARLVIALTEHLDPQHFRCRLVTGRVAGAEGDILEVERHAVRPVVIPELGRNPHPGRDLVAFWKLARLIRRVKPAIVHTHAAKAGAFGRLAARVCGVPIVVHSFHGHVLHGYFGPAVSRAIVAFERGMAALTDAILVPGRSQQSEIAERYRIAAAAKVHVVPYGIDVAFFGAPADRHRCRLRFALPEEARVIVSVGRMAPVKNHALLVDSFARLAAIPAFADVHLLIVGDGECRGEIEAQVVALSVASRVRIAGWVSDLREAYGAADVLALTSHNEGMPVAVMEAMAAGVPVVSTPAGGVVDLIEHGETGWMVGEPSPAEFARGLEALLVDGKLRARLASRARRHVTEHHSEAVGVRHLERLYEDLLARGRR